MAKTVELRRATRYSINGVTFTKGEPKIVNDAMAALLSEKYDTTDVPMFRVSEVKKSDIPPAPVARPLEVVEEAVGMSDEDLAKMESDREALEAELNTSVSTDADGAPAAAAAAGKIRVSKKTAPVNEPSVTV